MVEPDADPDAVVFAAVSFAARAHRHQVRKDGVTPYAAHPARVAFVVRHSFGCADPEVSAAALLHDVIEDTPADYDDVAAAFGPRVAGWVAALTKDMRLPEPDREAAYRAALAAGPWPVVLVKLADIFDNLADGVTLPPAVRTRSIHKAAALLDALRPAVTAETAAAFARVEGRLAESAGGGLPGAAGPG